VTFLTPFVVFLLSKKKTLKGMIESVAHFIIGILLATFLMLIGWSSIKSFYKKFSYSKGWTG
jgi:divalent metal cation (Fe/Co/Zn/Cd) transporter